MSAAADPVRAWVRARLWMQRLCILGLLLAPLVHGLVTLFVRQVRFRDFDVHREFGRRFLAGLHLYDDGICHPYLSAAAMYFAPLALVERQVGFALRYTVAIVCLWLSFRLLHRMLRDRFPSVASHHVFLSAATVILSFQFISQDLDDGGPHLILLAILMGGVYAVWRGREQQGAMWFGLAVALKVTPALFVPFFMWKRQWRLAVLTVVAAACWILLPMIHMGPLSWVAHHHEWIRVAAGSFVGQDTTVTQLNAERVRNQSLEQALLRYFVTYPQDHPLRRDDLGYFPVLDLSPQTATLLVMVAMAGLVGLVCWYGRGSYRGPGDPSWLPECSAVLVVALLLSPATWVQHLVWLVPALYVIVASAAGNGGLGKGATFALGVYALLAVALNYEVLGKHNYALFLTYHPYTIAMLLVLAMLQAERQAGEQLRWAPVR